MTRHSRLLLWVMVLTTVGLAWPSKDVAAQRAVPRRGPTTGMAVPRTYAPRYYRPYSYPRYSHPRYYYPYRYSPYYYSPWYYRPYYSSFAFSFGFGWPGPYWGAYSHGYPYAYPYAYPYSYPYAYPYYWYDNSGSARLEITPRNAQVYVDGRFVGIVDDFDGSLQRLRVGNGQHEIQIYLEGYRPLTQKVLFTPGTTVNIQSALQPLGPGESEEPKPAPDRATVPDSYQRQAPVPHRRDEPTEFGTLFLRVNPADSVIVIDGEVWERPEGENRFSIDLAEGPHQVEVRKEGYGSYVRTIELRRGRTYTLNVSLTRGDARQLEVYTRRESALRRPDGPTRYR
jgi:hypothetical protein